MSYESRISNIENFLSKETKFETPRSRAEKISKKEGKEHHVGKPSPLMIETKVNAFLNSFESKSLSKDEKNAARKIIEEMVDHIETDIEDKSQKENLTARLKQAYEKLESKK